MVIPDTAEERYQTYRRRLIQLVVATVPLFFVLCYLLYQTAIHKPGSNNDNVYQDDANVNSEVVEFLDLDELLHIFLLLFYLSMLFLIYVTLFIPKRRALMKRYKNYGILVFGDVIEPQRPHIQAFCFGCCAQSKRTFEASYTIPPDVNLMDESTMDHRDAKDVQGERSCIPVRYSKTIRTFFPYSRERIPFYVLPKRPRSGLPKSDVDRDIAQFESAPPLTGVRNVILFWVLFTFLSSLYTVFIYKNYYESVETNNILGISVNTGVWGTFLFSTGLSLPICFLLNYFRFRLYWNWLVMSAKLIKDPAAVSHHQTTSDDPLSGIEGGGDTAYVRIT